MSGTLYVVATPIGNLGDITLRAVEILKTVAAVVCEDTRVTQKLLQHYGIDKPLCSYHHHSTDKVTNGLVDRLRAGESLAYVTDAGTPGVADPAGKLVAAAAVSDIPIVPIPGVSAVTTILSVAGINLQEFVFLGYPPHKKGRVKFFNEVVASSKPVVFYESTYRINKALFELEKLAPSKKLIVGRELTKKFETIYRGTPAEVLAALQQTSTLGEFVIVVAP
ncbi:MAG: 16S rRNA (cytidine(1402)-2'-O)-methyltransferase [Candidatus Kerfeldbacteria bacterium]|nr:16S rRNA (cytidine(1402)-2'-O)-methyltransferase [Candidatus Kerfeldbacteria bacterium]